ncbi:glutathionylspermidine synthase family protein [Streptomyces sp. NBC_01221]|uniref:glutathionylspermidine synthase family protein n=1 Tax=Streptomyces sp. NBC_01221 TaxID=2903782 RepID=UPI00225C3104|nr:glutathionylspermidine synthase family protein [Streptomyces sp. NBC_01221]MCX4791877.1 glutathionylspermidine synthase family protein [Streptomyces sp. NBC_01221]
MPAKPRRNSTQPPPGVEPPDSAENRLAKRLLEAGVHFEGRAYPVSPRPFFLEESEAAGVRTTAEKLHNVVDKVVDAYGTSDVVRQHFPHYEKHAHLMMPPEALRPAARVCRFDGVVDAEGTYKLMETNTACPGGVIQNGITSRLWDQECGAPWRGPSHEWLPQPLESDHYAFVRELLDCHRAQFGGDPQFAVVVNWHGRYTNEVDWMLAQFREHGLRAERVEAEELRYQRGRLTWRGSPVDLAYNKLDQLDLVHDAAASEYLRAAADGAVCCLNPLISQCILEDKAVLALLSDDRSAPHLGLSVEDEDVIRRHIPWTRTAGTGMTSDPEGRSVQLLDFAVAAREHLVLKPRHLTRGEGVAIGRWTGADRWAALLADAARSQDYVLQSYQPLSSLTVPESRATAGGEMMHGLDTYLFGGKAVGFQCRASYDPVTNIGRRGVLLPVVVRKGALKS